MTTVVHMEGAIEGAFLEAIVEAIVVLMLRFTLVMAEEGLGGALLHLFVTGVR